MISSLKVEGYRGLKQFEMGQLGREFDDPE